MDIVAGGMPFSSQIGRSRINEDLLGDTPLTLLLECGYLSHRSRRWMVESPTSANKAHNILNRTGFESLFLGGKSPCRLISSDDNPWRP